MKKVYILRVAVVLLFVFALSVLTASAVELRAAFWGGPEEIEIEQKNLDEFMRLNPDIKVELGSIPESYEQKILTSVAANTAPDVFLLDSVIIPAFINKNVLLNLTPYIAPLGIDTEQFYQNVLNLAKRGNKLYAFPKDFTPMVIYYNKNLFDEAGLPYPQSGWSWEDYLRYAKLLTKDIDNDGKTDQFGATFSKWLYMWQPWVWANGGDVLNPDGNKATGYFNSKNTEDAITFLLDLVTVHKVAPSPETLSAMGGTGMMFYTGKVGMVESGHWWLPTIRKYIDTGDINVGVVGLPTPEGKEHVTVMYEAGWCVPESTKYKKEAVKLAAFLAGEFSQTTRGVMGLAIPAVISVAETVVENDSYGLEKIFVSEVPYCRQPWGTILEKFSMVEDITANAIEEVLVKQTDIHTVFTKAAEQIDKELSQ